jgi:hypothetical protein
MRAWNSTWFPRPGVERFRLASQVAHRLPRWNVSTARLTDPHRHDRPSSRNHSARPLPMTSAVIPFGVASCSAVEATTTPHLIAVDNDQLCRLRNRAGMRRPQHNRSHDDRAHQRFDDHPASRYSISVAGPSPCWTACCSSVNPSQDGNHASRRQHPGENLDERQSQLRRHPAVVITGHHHRVSSSNGVMKLQVKLPLSATGACQVG